eukprot:TRINITY_DN15747_c0_g1_i1.p1 TRINITY_DN15747_c0_g1~~TRINITY_DN15747_c0_g1_i1.p1  ORF type:complete len:141 (-),score=35.22 TRINITY_DN15747_c0_g1_i1:116-538(-)
MSRLLHCAFFAAVVVFAIASVAADDTAKIDRLQVGVTFRPEVCDKKSKNGDKLSMKYKGSLKSDGTVFDSNFDSDRPFVFTLGAGQVIKGWDQGLLGMCPGEKRKLRIPSNMAYGSRGAGGRIPPNADLIFEVELVDILN